MKITKTQLKQLIKEELDNVVGESQWQDNFDSWEEERRQERELASAEEGPPEESPDAADTLQSIGAKLVQMTEDQLAKVDSWLMRMFGDDSPDAEWRKPFGSEVKDLPQQDPAYKYSGTSRMSEAKKKTKK